jgi:peroxiredoxin
MYDAFEERGVTVIALAQEDTDLAQHGQIAGRIEGDLRFELAADLNRAKSTTYDRLTTYLIDADGVVRQVVPQMIRRRVDWNAILSEIDRLKIGRTPAAPGPAPAPAPAPTAGGERG